VTSKLARQTRNVDFLVVVLDLASISSVMADTEGNSVDSNQFIHERGKQLDLAECVEVGTGAMT
jgi:hypothetical protein